MSRFARDMAVVYWEEPVEIGRRETAFLQVREARECASVRLVVPHVPEGLDDEGREAVLCRLLEAYSAGLTRPLIAWYYTPMMLPFSRHLDASLVVFDAMDELSKFRFAPPRLLDLEQELIDRADLIFTGGSSLYEAKKDRHPSVHCFPSSVDRAHFAKARAVQDDPADQKDLPRPRLGFYGVIDERFDIELLDKAAEQRLDWQFVMVGPVVKISEDELPRRPNIHYLGPKSYAELPRYLSGWDVALMPFAMNESTEFISPTKTPEYLAGGRPVVSTPVRDVVRHYGHLQGVRIAADADRFVAACDELLQTVRAGQGDWLAEADLLLSATSWDTTQARMAGLVRQALGEGKEASVPALLAAAE
ncbi:MAG TPA: glycosyltransferase [Sphingomicrobium sp.]|nr:glycosyltransferase [Sphingomicrobium sp.]